MSSSSEPTAPGAGGVVPPRALEFGDPLSQRSQDDTEVGWGDSSDEGGDADIARFLAEKPPHHL